MRKAEEVIPEISKKIIDELDKIFRSEKATEDEIKRAKEKLQEKYVEFMSEEDRKRWYPELTVNVEENEVLLEWKDIH